MTATAIKQETTRQTDTAPPPAPDDTAIAISRIVAETGCTEQEATAGLEFIADMAQRARVGTRTCVDEPGTHHLTTKEMRRPGYRVMDLIMEHCERAKPGSAHEAVQNVVLDTAAGERALIHDNPSGKPTDCRVTIRVF